MKDDASGYVTLIYILIAGVCMLPLIWGAAVLVSRVWFRAKLRYHRTILSGLDLTEGERRDGK